MVLHETIETRELMANKFSVGTVSPPITTQVTVADAVVQNIAGGDNVDIVKLTADLLSIKTAVNLVIARLDAVGITAP